MSEWTVDTLKEYVDRQFSNQERAILKQAEETKENRAKDNEFRGELRDRTATYPTRLEMDAKIQALEDKISSKNLQIMLSLAIGFIGVLIAVFNLASATS